jgi:hypothetical protein
MMNMLMMRHIGCLPCKPLKNSTKEDEDNSSEERHGSVDEEEEEGMVEGTQPPISQKGSF